MTHVDTWEIYYMERLFKNFFYDSSLPTGKEHCMKLLPGVVAFAGFPVEPGAPGDPAVEFGIEAPPAIAAACSRCFLLSRNPCNFCFTSDEATALSSCFSFVLIASSFCRSSSCLFFSSQYSYNLWWDRKQYLYYPPWKKVENIRDNGQSWIQSRVVECQANEGNCLAFVLSVENKISVWVSSLSQF